MTDQSSPEPGELRSLPETVLLAAAVSVIGVTAFKYLLLLVTFTPVPPAPVWVDYLVFRAGAGVSAGVVAYLAERRPRGWLRTCLSVVAILLLFDGDVDDLARWSLHAYLAIWAATALGGGLLIATGQYALRRFRPRAAPSDAS